MTSGKLMTFSASVQASSPKRTSSERRLSNGSLKRSEELSLDSSSSNSNSSNSKGIAKKRKTRCCRTLDKEEIIKYFSVKEEEAAQLLNVSKSKLKRIKKEMGISRWPYRRLEALKQELHDIEERLKNIQSIKSNNSTSQFFNTNSNNLLQSSPQPQSNTTSSSTQLQLEESILKGSIELIHHIPNIIVKHSNEHIKEIARKTQRISLSNLLNL